MEEAQHAAKAYTLMVRLFAKVIDRVSDAVAEREAQKSIRPELVTSIGCQLLECEIQAFISDFVAFLRFPFIAIKWW